MINDEQISRIYALIETTDFEQLNESDRLFVLDNISEEEYKTMRQTIKDTRKMFSEYPSINWGKTQGIMKRIITYPVELYKIAVAAVLVIGIGLVLTQLKHSQQNNLLATVDTVYIERTDTFVVHEIETLETTHDKILNKEPVVSLDQHSEVVFASVTSTPAGYNSWEISPDDIQRFNVLQSNHNFSKDRLLKDFIVSMN